MAGTKHPAETGSNPLLGHEERDVNTFAVTAAGLGIFGMVLIVIFGMWFVFHFLAEREAAKGPPLVSAPQLPPEPRLQATPVADYKAIRAAEDRILNSYGWIDPDKGVVRIPVSRALEIVARKGLPASKK
jgi:type IV secretory pathway TrbD component